MKTPNIESITSAQRIICISPPTPLAGSYFWIFIFKKVRGKFLFHCNFNYTRLPVTLPEFYKECIVTWILLNGDKTCSSSEIANKVLCFESKSIYNKMIDLGIVRIGDLYDTGTVEVEKGTIIFNSLTSWTFSTFQSLQYFFRRMAQNIEKWKLYLPKNSWSNANWFQFTY